MPLSVHSPLILQQLLLPANAGVLPTVALPLVPSFPSRAHAARTRHALPTLFIGYPCPLGQLPATSPSPLRFLTPLHREIIPLSNFAALSAALSF